MQCSQCGANVRPDMMECPECGAPLDPQQRASFPSYRPPDLYVPGGGVAPQQPTPSGPPELAPGQRPLGSLQRRLQRSQASLPGGDDLDDEGEDIWRDLPPARPPRSSGPAQRSRASEGQGYGSRRPSSGADDGYGERGRRSRPTNEPAPRRGSRASGGARSRAEVSRYGAYDGFEDSREEPAYTPYPAYQPDWDDSREQPAWDESREGPAQRRSGRPDRYRSLDDSGDLGDSAEMSVEGPAYGPPRRPAPRRSRPMEERRRGRDEYTNPLDDPRSPLRGGSQSRRPSQGGRGGRAPSRYADDYPGGYGPDGSGYAEDEMRAPGYQDYQGYDDRYGERGGDGYNEEMRAAGVPRGRSGYPAPYELDDGASRERWAAPGGARDVGFPSYEDAAYGQVGLSGTTRQPGASASRSRRAGSTSARKPQRKGGAARVVIGLLLLLAVVAVVGVEFGPKVYHRLLSRTSGGGSPTNQATVTCATETTPTTQSKPPAGQSLFATTAYTLTYPTSWQKNSQSGSSQSQCDVVYLFSQANGPAKFNVEEAGSFAPITDQQIIQAEAQSAQQQGSSFSEITSAATTQSVGGEVWQRREYQVTTKDSTKLHLALLAGHHKGAGFAIVLISSDTGFSNDDTMTFEPVLHSFQFV